MGRWVELGSLFATTAQGDPDSAPGLIDVLDITEGGTHGSRSTWKAALSYQMLT
jgi:hypothetical protein